MISQFGAHTYSAGPRPDSEQSTKIKGLQTLIRLIHPKTPSLTLSLPCRISLMALSSEHHSSSNCTAKSLWLAGAGQGFISVVVVAPEASLWSPPLRRHCRCPHEDVFHTPRDSSVIEDTLHAMRDSSVSEEPSCAPWRLNVLSAPAKAA
ncbi:hypothetical protein L484_008966 [Morus notabilis]|uniref:Uncharacterized protein n=1 Tax=Morus notabilis TaxID=981085 RepID=W9SAV9_9ROSA|nr:hypothetical protein L484_008966 [Morus notabilis]